MLRHAHVITLHNTVVGDSHDTIGISARTDDEATDPTRYESVLGAAYSKRK
jgi:hypothetical protein